MRQHLDRDAIHWVPPVPVSTDLQATFSPHVAPARPLLAFFFSTRTFTIVPRHPGLLEAHRSIRCCRFAGFRSDCGSAVSVKVNCESAAFGLCRGIFSCITSTSLEKSRPPRRNYEKQLHLICVIWFGFIPAAVQCACERTTRLTTGRSASHRCFPRKSWMEQPITPTTWIPARLHALCCKV